MARKLRVEYEGAIYHVMNRGDRREPIFREDSDRELFLQTMGEACAKTDKLRTYRWSSCGEHLKSPGRRLKWVRSGRLLGEMGIPRDSKAGRREFEKRMELRRREDEPEEWKRVRRGWCLGDETFRKELIEAMESRLGPEHYGEERRASAEAKAQCLVEEELRKMGWTEQSLEERPKGDKKKIRIAQRLRRETENTFEPLVVLDRSSPKMTMALINTKNRPRIDQNRPRIDPESHPTVEVGGENAPEQIARLAEAQTLQRGRRLDVLHAPAERHRRKPHAGPAPRLPNRD